MPYAIRICKESLELITELNGGVEPEIEDTPTFYIVNGPRTPNEIITETEYANGYTYDYGPSLIPVFKK